MIIIIIIIAGAHLGLLNISKKHARGAFFSFWVTRRLGYAVFFCDHSNSTGCLAFSFIRQTVMGSLTCAQLWVRAVRHSKAAVQELTQERRTIRLSPGLPSQGIEARTVFIGIRRSDALTARASRC